MSADVVGSFFRRWWFIGAALVSLGIWSKNLDARIEQKADRSDYVLVQYQLTTIQAQLVDITARLRQMSCAGKPDYCR